MTKRSWMPGRAGVALRAGSSLMVVALASGCATFSADGGFGTVEKTVKDRLGKDVIWERSDVDRNTVDKRVAELLAKPLGADDAVQLALLNNKGLQASYADLGISEADLVQAGRLPIQASRSAGCDGVTRSNWSADFISAWRA